MSDIGQRLTLARFDRQQRPRARQIRNTDSHPRPCHRSGVVAIDALHRCAVMCSGLGARLRVRRKRADFLTLCSPTSARNTERVLIYYAFGLVAPLKTETKTRLFKTN